VNAALANVALHLTDIINSFGYMKFVFILVPVFLILDPDKRRSPLFIILFLQGVCVILGCALSLWWLPRLGGDAGRFSLVPFITLGTLGFLSIKEILQRLFVKRARALAFLFFVTAVLLLFRIEVKNYLVFRNYYLHIHPRRYMGYRRDRDEMYEWIRENSGGDDLIASNFLADAFLLKRPFVSLPPSKAVTPGNVVDFLKIYEPRYVLTVDQGLVNILKDTGYTEKKRKGRMVIFGK
jgi:hypothetical protein